MLGTNQKKKQGFFKGCIVPFLVMIGLVAGCFLFCSGIYYINDLSAKAEASAKATREVNDFNATQTAISLPTIPPTPEPVTPEVQVTTLPEVPLATPVP